MQSGDIIANRFVIERLAGKGGMGEVYLAYERDTRAPVAIKVLRDATAHQTERFLREAQTLSTLHHPNIVRYISHGYLHNHEPFLAMEWLEGEGLSDLFMRRALTIEESLSFFGEVLGILAYAHSQGVIHRDIKPSNIFLRHNKLTDPVLLDFGIARLVGVHAPMTKTDAMIGTPGYIAPEQARGAQDLDSRADLFSLGCVFFECLTGRPPFWGEHVIAILSKILLEEAPRVRELLPEAPEALDDWLAGMLAKAPESRPSSANEARELLSSIELQEPSERKILTEQERKLFCVVLWESSDAKTIQQDLVTLPGDASVEVTRDALSAAVSSMGGRLEPLANGSMVVVFWGSKAVTDLAVQGARCALELQQLLPQVSFAMSIGRAEQARPVGEALDRAATLLKSARIAGIYVDSLLSSLLDARFELVKHQQSLLLLQERIEPTAGRTLLGRTTPYVGRESELRLLEGLLDDCVENTTAKVILVTAHAGAGKSRLRQEFLRRVEKQHPRAKVILGYGEPLKASSPFGVLAPALRRHMGLAESDPLDMRRSKIKNYLAEIVSPQELLRVSHFLGEMMGVPYPEEESAALCAAHQNRRLMRDQMLRAFEDWLYATCQQQPLLLVIEDLQWGDLPTIQFIDEALDHLRELPLFVFAMARPELNQVFPRLWESRDRQEVCLGRLSKKACTQLARTMLGEQFSASMIERLVEQAGGNAFYLEELIRAAAEGKSEALPETVLAMAQSRLEELSQESRRALRAASIFGDTFWDDGVRALLGEEQEPLSSCLEALCQREILQPRLDTPEEGDYRFRHALYREASYAALTEEDRKLGHRLAAEWFISHGETDAQMLASHFERSGDIGRAIEWYCRAAGQALEAGDLEAVFSYVERGKLAGAQGEMLGELFLLAAEAHMWRGENVNSEALSDEAMRCLSLGSSRWYRAAQNSFRALGRLGLRDKLLALVTQMSSIESKQSTRADEVLAWSCAFFALHVLGVFDLAHETFARFERLVAQSSVDDPILAFDIPWTRALWASLSGDVGDALEFYRAAIAVCQNLGDQRRECVATVSATFVYIELGGYEHTERSMRKVISLSEKMGLRSVNAHAKNLLALALSARGQHQEAITLAAEAVRSFTEQRDRRNEGGTRYDLARVLLRAGQGHQALQQALLAVEALEIAPPIRATALAVLAEIYLALGDPQQALSASTQGIELLESLGSTEDNEALIRLMYAESLAACSYREAANEALYRAKERLFVRAAKIKDKTWRTNFVENVPEHRRTFTRE
jgi:serine/threonine protein kinase/tetratricopeptide (TPR) repeat protein